MSALQPSHDCCLGWPPLWVMPVIFFACSLCGLHSLCPCCCWPPLPPPPILSHRRSEAALGVALTMQSGSPVCVFGCMHPFRAWFVPCVTMACAYGCVYVLARLSSVCPGRWWVVAPSDPTAPSLQLVGPLAGAGEQGLRCTVCRLPPAQVLAVCGGAGQEIAVPPSPPPMSCAFPR